MYFLTFDITIIVTLFSLLYQKLQEKESNVRISKHYEYNHYLIYLFIRKLYDLLDECFCHNISKLFKYIIYQNNCYITAG